MCVCNAACVSACKHRGEELESDGATYRNVPETKYLVNEQRDNRQRQSN